MWWKSCLFLLWRKKRRERIVRIRRRALIAAPAMAAMGILWAWVVWVDDDGGWMEIRVELKVEGQTQGETVNSARS
jgi:hypothetical protein